MSEERESASELCCQPFGAWDFPLSRGDKIRRLLLLFEAEVASSDQEIHDLKQQLQGRETGCSTSKCSQRNDPDFSANASQSAEETQAVRKQEGLVTSTGLHKAQGSNISTHDATYAADVQRIPSANASSETFTPPPKANGEQEPLVLRHPRSSTPGSAPHVPRQRRRTTIFRLPDESMVRIPRRTAPAIVPMQSNTNAHASTTRKSTSARLSDCFESFGDDSDSDDMLTPRSLSSTASVSGRICVAHEAESSMCAQEKRKSGMLQTPDGVFIEVLDSPAGADCKGFREPRLSKSSCVHELETTLDGIANECNLHEASSPKRASAAEFIEQ